MAATLGADINTVNYIYTNVSATEMSIEEFVNACGGVNSTDANIKTVAMIIANQSTKMDYNTINNFVGIGTDKTKTLYLLKDADLNKMSVNSLINFILTRYAANDEKIVNSFTTEQISSLKQAVAIISISGNEYNYTEMASVFGTMNTNITSNETKLLYGLYNYQVISVNDTKSVKEIINFLVANKNDHMISSKLGDNIELLSIESLRFQT